MASASYRTDCSMHSLFERTRDSMGAGDCSDQRYGKRRQRRCVAWRASDGHTNRHGHFKNDGHE